MVVRVAALVFLLAGLGVARADSLALQPVPRFSVGDAFPLIARSRVDGSVMLSSLWMKVRSASTRFSLAIRAKPSPGNGGSAYMV